MSFKVAVVGGAGHIGLPFSCSIANKGIETVIIDIDEDNIKKISNKTPPFFEDEIENQLSRAIDLGMKATKDMTNISSCNIVFITLGTSSNEKDIANFNKLVEEVIEHTNKEATILLRSTISPGTMKRISKTHEKNNDLRFIYAPERIAEGKAFKEFKEIPQIIGCKNDEDFQYISQFFRLLDIDVLKTSYEEAEFLKLFLNTYRYMQFSTLNFFHNIAYDNSLDFKRILSIASMEYPRLESVPDSGFVGGPCLIKDSKTFSKSYPNSENLINIFLKVNEDFIDNIIRQCFLEFKNKRIIQLGLTFKPESDDLRDSQANLLYQRLIEEGFDVEVYDPYLQNTLDWDDIKNFSENVIIATNHPEFQNLELNNKKVMLIGTK